MHPPQGHRSLTDAHKKRLRRITLHDRLVTGTERGIQPRLALDPAFILVPAGNVLQCHDALLAPTVLREHAQLHADKRFAAIAPANAPIYRIDLNLAAYQAIDPLQILRQIGRTDQISPYQGFHLLRRIAHDAAKMPVKPPPAGVRQVSGGNADERQRKKLLHQLVRSRLLDQHFQSLDSLQLSPEKPQHHSESNHGQRGHGANPPGQHMHGFQHFGAVDLRHHMPVRAGHRPEGCKHLYIAVVPACHLPGFASA